MASALLTLAAVAARILCINACALLAWPGSETHPKRAELDQRPQAQDDISIYISGGHGFSPLTTFWLLSFSLSLSHSLHSSSPL